MCNAVCWRNGQTSSDEFPGQCSGFETVNGTSTDAGDGGESWEVGEGIECDSAGWIDERPL